MGTEGGNRAVEIREVKAGVGGGFDMILGVCRGMSD